MRPVPWTWNTSCIFEILIFYTEIWHIRAKSRCYFKPVRLVEVAEKLINFELVWQQAKRCQTIGIMNGILAPFSSISMSDLLSAKSIVTFDGSLQNTTVVEIGTFNLAFVIFYSILLRLGHDSSNAEYAGANLTGFLIPNKSIKFLLPCTRNSEVTYQSCQVDMTATQLKVAKTSVSVESSYVGGTVFVLW